MVLGDTGPRAANTWVSTWTGKQLVEPPQALDEPRHHTAKMVCVWRSRGETDALANSDARKQVQLKTRRLGEHEQMDDPDDKKPEIQNTVMDVGPEHRDG